MGSLFLILLFSQIFLIFQSNEADCSLRRFPKFLGSTNGKTDIQQIDVDSSNNIVMAGRSADSDLVASSGSNPAIALYYPNSGYDFTWAKTFTVYQLVRKTQFRPDGTRLFILFTQPFTVLILNSANGALIAQAVDKVANQLREGTNAYYLNDDYVYFALPGWSYITTYAAYKFDTGATGSQAYVMAQLQQYTFQMFAAVQGESGIMYSGGEASRAIGTEGLQMCITRIQFTYDSSTTLMVPSHSWTFINTPSPSQDEFQINVINYHGSSSQIFFCAEKKVSTNVGVMIAKIYLNGNSAPTNHKTLYYTEGTNLLKGLDIYVKTSTEIITYIANYDTASGYLLNVNFGSDTQVIYFKTPITTSDFVSASVNSVKFISQTTYYFGGTLQKLNTCTSSYSNYIGFIAVYDNDQSCYSLSNTPGATVSVSYHTTYYQTATGFATTPLTVVLERDEITMSDMIIANLYKIPTDCCYTIVQQAYTTQIYIIDYPTTTYQFPAFTFTTTCTNPPTFTYSSLMVSGASLPTYIQFASGTQIFSIQTSDQNTLNTYSVQVKGVLQNKQYSIQTFNFEFESLNPYGIISYGISNAVYIVGQTTLTHTFTQFRPTDKSYYIIYYLYKSDDSAFDSSYITFTNGQQASSLQIYTTDNGKKGTYNMKMVGKLTANALTNTTATELFTIEIKDQCYGAVITSSSIPDLSYQMRDPIANDTIHTFAAWTDSIGQCGSITYTPTLEVTSVVNGVTVISYTTLPDFIKFDVTTYTFTIGITDQMTKGTYTVFLKGELIPFSISKTISFKIIITCVVTSIKPILPYQTISYILESQRIIYFMPDFDQIPNCQYTVSYTGKQSNGKVLPAVTRIVVIPQDNMFFRYFSIFSIDPQFVDKTYDLVYEGVLVQSDFTPAIIKNSFSWQLKVLPKSTLIDEEVEQTFPDLNFTTKVGVPMNKKHVRDPRDKNTYIYDEQKIVSDFSFYDERIFEIVLNPTKDSQAGIFQTSFRVITKNPQGKEVSYVQRIFITVLTRDGKRNETNTRSETAKNKTATNSTSNFTSISNETTENKTEFLLNYYKDQQIEVLDQPDTELNAYIKSINQVGVVLVEFTKDLYVHRNISILNESAMWLNLSNPVEWDIQRNVKFQWNVTSFTKRQMKIKMYFEDPFAISQSSINLANYTQIFATSYSIATLISLIALILLNFFVGRKVYLQIFKNGDKNDVNQRIEDANKRYFKVNAIFEGFKLKSYYSLQFNTLFVFRRLIIGNVLVFWIEEPVVQIWFMLISTMFCIFFLLLWSPFESKLTNVMEIINEIFVVLAVYHLFPFSDFCDDYMMKYDIGWSINLIVLLQILLNTGVILFISIKEQILMIKRYCKKWKARQQLKYLQSQSFKDHSLSQPNIKSMSSMLTNQDLKKSYDHQPLALYDSSYLINNPNQLLHTNSNISLYNNNHNLDATVATNSDRSNLDIQADQNRKNKPLHRLKNQMLFQKQDKNSKSQKKSKQKEKKRDKSQKIKKELIDIDQNDLWEVSHYDERNLKTMDLKQMNSANDLMATMDLNHQPFSLNQRKHGSEINVQRNNSSNSLNQRENRDDGLDYIDYLSYGVDNKNINTSSINPRLPASNNQFQHQQQQVLQNRGVVAPFIVGSRRKNPKLF